MKCAVIGPGRIGCGFAGQLLRASGHEVTFLARKEQLVEHLNRVGRYRVRLVDTQASREIVVDGVRAVSTAEPAAARELAAADLIVTAVGASELPSVAPLIGAGLQRRDAPVNVLAFENFPDCGAHLQKLVAGHLPRDFPVARHGFSGAVVSRAVAQRLGCLSGDEPLVFVGDAHSTFAVSGPDLRAPLEPIEGMTASDDLAAWMKRKLYIFSAGHATCAYLGNLKGYHYIHTAICDPEIRDMVLATMCEGQRGIAALYGRAFAGDERDLLEITRRFENPVLEDSIRRVGRDPCRKLAPDDRLVGAAQLARLAGVRPERLLQAAAAAFYFDANDPAAARLQSEVKAGGLGPALLRVSGLDHRRGLGRLVHKYWAQFARDWRQNNVLLSIDPMLWTWTRSHWHPGRNAAPAAPVSKAVITGPAASGPAPDAARATTQASPATALAAVRADGFGLDAAWECAVIEESWQELRGKVSRERISEVAIEARAKFAGATVTAFLPILARRFVRERLKQEMPERRA